jgi:integrase
MNGNSRKEKRNRKSGGFVRVGECLYRNTENGIYYVKMQVSGREFTRSLRTTDRELANRKRDDFRNEQRQLDHAAADRMTLAALCDRYRSTFAHRKPKTKIGKEHLLNLILDTWPTGKFTRIGEVRSSDCDLWLARQASELRVSSRNGYVWFLRDLFELAVRDRMLAVSPAVHLKGARRPTPIRLTPTFEEFTAIIADVRAQPFNADARDSADFLEFMGLAGLGQAEVSSLTRADVDLAAGRITTFRHKTSTGFKIPIYPQVRPPIERLCKGKRPNDQLFKIADARKALAGACRRLGYPPYSQRSLRRMFVTRAIERGVDVKVIAEWQGHRDAALILSTYSHVRPIHSDRMPQLMTA